MDSVPAAVDPIMLYCLSLNKQTPFSGLSRNRENGCKLIDPVLTRFRRFTSPSCRKFSSRDTQSASPAVVRRHALLDWTSFRPSLTRMRPRLFHSLPLYEHLAWGRVPHCLCAIPGTRFNQRPDPFYRWDECVSCVRCLSEKDIPYGQP